MKKMVLAVALLLACASANVASAHETPATEAVTAVATAAPAVEGSTEVQVASLGRDFGTSAYWANYCFTPYGNCQLAVPMQNGSPCTCYWANGSWSSGYAQ